MKKSSSLSSVRNLVLFVTFLFYLFIASQIPYTQDDWNWGIDAGIRSFITADQNSRYAGNLLVLLLTRSATLKNIVMAAVFTVIPYMMVRIIDITEEREFWVMYLLANVLILIMPVTVWRQTYGWVSGFANFVASMPFVCGHILILKKYLFNQCDSETVQFQAGRSVMLFAFSLIGQLFFENATVYFTAVYLCANAFFIVRCRKIHPYLFTAFVGTCIGAAIMFSSSLYDTLVSTGTAYEGYRELTVDLDGGVPGIVGSIIHSFCYQSAQQVTVEFYPQTILILLCMTYFLIMRKTKFSVLLALGNVGMGAIYAVVWGAGIFVPYRYKIAFGLFYFLTIFTEYIYIYIYEKSCISTAFVWISVYGIVLPLAVTNFAGGRLLLAPYILVNIFVLNLISEAIRTFTIRRIATVCICAAALLLVIRYSQVYVSIGDTTRARLEAISAAVEQNAGVIYLKKYEYPEFLWGQEPVGEDRSFKWVRDFKIYYAIPQDYEIRLSD